MFNGLKKLVPPSWKNKLRNRFQSEVFKTTGFDTAFIKRIEELERSVFELQPEIVSCTTVIKETIEQHWQYKDIAIPGNLSISKHDYMYQFLQRHFNDAVTAYTEYISSGAHMIKILKHIEQQLAGNFARINNFLDFASGYGRLTRYTVELLKPGQIWISDIKQGAVDFQVQQFGVNGILSTENPGSFQINRQFDFIFVGSLFSHLPPATFSSWLQRIYGLLADDGILVFTVHGQNLNKNAARAKDDMVFLPVSEEANLVSKDGRLPGTQYGTAYVSEQYVAENIANLQPRAAQYKCFPKGMWGLQDVYIVTKSEKENLSKLTL